MNVIRENPGTALLFGLLGLLVVVVLIALLRSKK